MAADQGRQEALNPGRKQCAGQQQWIVRSLNLLRLVLSALPLRHCIYSSSLGKEDTYTLLLIYKINPLRTTRYNIPICHCSSTKEIGRVVALKRWAADFFWGGWPFWTCLHIVDSMIGQFLSCQRLPPSCFLTNVPFPYSFWNWISTTKILYCQPL